MNITHNTIKGKTYTNVYLKDIDKLTIDDKKLLMIQHPNVTFFIGGSKPIKETLVKALESIAF
jgi:hypothetical protein